MLKFVKNKIMNIEYDIIINVIGAVGNAAAYHLAHEIKKYLG